jgi:hypothetical protein
MKPLPQRGVNTQIHLKYEYRDIFKETDKEYQQYAKKGQSEYRVCIIMAKISYYSFGSPVLSSLLSFSTLSLPSLSDESPSLESFVSFSSSFESSEADTVDAPSSDSVLPSPELSSASSVSSSLDSSDLLCHYHHYLC